MSATHLIMHLQWEIENLKPSPSRQFKIRAIQKVISQLRLHKKITAKTIQAMEFTPHMKQKLIAMLGKKAPPTTSKQMIMEVLGIGNVLAQKLVESGAQSVADLENPRFFSMLPLEARLIIKYKPCRKIPRAVIQRLESKLCIPQYDVTLTGSYRRGKAFSRDVDVMVSENPAKFRKYCNYVLDTFQAEQYTNGDRTSCLLHFENLILKIDIFRAENKYAMLLYSTGSKEFNIRMRRRAKQLGMLLNQHGLWRNGTKVHVKDERGFFTKLGWEYIEPQHRL
jgi:DNA polymerase/3'-5' exonuclease PolX